MLKSSKAMHELKSVVQEFEGSFICDPGVPIPVIKEMLFDFMKLIGQIEDAIATKQKEEAEKEKPAPDISPELPSPEA